MYDLLKYELKSDIAYITINRPSVLNALNSDLLDEILAAFKHAAVDAGVVILTGEGKAFVAGADIAEMLPLNEREAKALMMKGHQVMSYIESFEKPVIAAVNGFALGGGCELALACDIRIASETAKFGQPETGLGIIPGFGATQRLSRLVGTGMSKYLILTGEIISADEAYRIGLVEKVVPAEELMGAAEKVAKTLLTKAPIALESAKMAINIGYNLDINTACKLEVEAFGIPFGSEDRKEGMGAFLEKRAPNFQNK